LGSADFLRPEYYKIITDSWEKRFPESTFKLVDGEYSQKMFDRYSDKQGLVPGEIPAEDKLMQFAWSHSFDRVVFILPTVTALNSNDFTQVEKVQVTLNARMMVFSSRSRKKTSDAQISQTAELHGREAAKKAAFEKCIDLLREKL
jgi:hypothetical protein